MALNALIRYGWDDGWAAELARIAAPAEPGRVVRHHGVAVDLATGDGITTVPLRRGLETAPVVGDWVAHHRATLLTVLPRRSLLERRSARRDDRHPLVANIDRVLITCGVDRPLNAGRIQRSATIAWEAGATPAVVLTKADLEPGLRQLNERVQMLERDHPGLEVTVTSSVTGQGLDELSAVIGHSTVALLGESGSGKSSLVNALADDDVAQTGDVRGTDRKGRHTTTSRELYPLPGGGILVDTPGLRSVGLWSDPDAVDATFEDITELADSCRFRDCAHDREPGCAVRSAIDEGHLVPERLASYRRLEQEAADSTRPHWDR